MIPLRAMTLAQCWRCAVWTRVSWIGASCASDVAPSCRVRRVWVAEVCAPDGGEDLRHDLRDRSAPVRALRRS